MRLFLACAALLVGCVRADLVECGDKLCAATQACIHDRCIDPALACTEPGSECDAAGTPGRCVDDVCEAATCGNGFVDPALREDCDDTIPDAHCVDFGFDLGRPGCTACQTDPLDGCIAFGWRLAVNAPAEQLWTDGETFAYWRFEPSSLEVHGPGIDASIPVVTVYDLKGGGGRIVFRGIDGISEVVNGAITPLAVPADVDANPINAFDVEPDGTLTVMAKCALWTRDPSGTWTTGPKIPTTNCVMLEVAGDHAFVVTGSNQIWQVSTSTSRLRFTIDSGVHQIVYGKAYGIDQLFIATANGLYSATDGSSSPQGIYDATSFTSVALADDAVYGFAVDLGLIVRFDGVQLGRLRPPSNRAITSGGDRLFAFGGPIYEFSGIDFSQRQEVPVFALQEVPIGILEPPAVKEPLVATSYGLFSAEPNGMGWTLELASPMQPLPIRAIGGSMSMIAYSAFLGSSEPDRRQTLGLQLPGVGATFEPVPDEPFIHGLWVASDATVFAVGDDEAGRGFLGKRDPRGEWSTFVPSGACSLRGVHAREPTSVVAVGACDGVAVAWRYDGSDWSELARLPSLPVLAGVLVLDANTVAAVGPNGFARLDGSTWTIDPTVVGNVLSGRPDDLWVSGSFTNVQHYDGTSWSQMTTRSLMPIQIIAHGRRVLLPGAAAGFSELLR